MDDSTTAGNAVRGSRRVWVPLAAVALLLLLGTVEVIAGRAAPKEEALPAGAVVSFGEDDLASVRVGDDWARDIVGSGSPDSLVLARGDTTVAMSVVRFARSGVGVDDMWRGFAGVLDIDRYKGAEVSVGEPSGFDSPAITGGLRAELRIDDRSGTAYLLPDPGRNYAIEVRALAPDGTGDDAWQAVVDSIAFEGEDA